MKGLFKIFTLLFIVGILTLPAVFVIYCIEETPLVAPTQGLSFDKVKKVKKLISDNKPTHIRKRQVRK